MFNSSKRYDVMNFSADRGEEKDAITIRGDNYRVFYWLKIRCVVPSLFSRMEARHAKNKESKIRFLCNNIIVFPLRVPHDNNTPCLLYSPTVGLLRIFELLRSFSTLVVDKRLFKKMNVIFVWLRI